jgi:hypothetical protein
MRKCTKYKNLFCQDFLTSDMLKDKDLQKIAISMHKQDVEYNYLYAKFRALEGYRKTEKNEKVQEI